MTAIREVMELHDKLAAANMEIQRLASILERAKSMCESCQYTAPEMVYERLIQLKQILDEK